jgi:DNA-binding response OmpR family regulator
MQQDKDSKKFVLIVEDEEHIAKGIQLTLEDSGYETLIALDGASAEAMLRERKPDLITLDIKMPGISGIDLLERLQNTEYLDGVKIILVSGMPVDELMQGLVSGADWVVEKPLDFDALLMKVNELLGTKD